MVIVRALTLPPSNHGMPQLTRTSLNTGVTGPIVDKGIGLTSFLASFECIVLVFPTVPSIWTRVTVFSSATLVSQFNALVPVAGTIYSLVEGSRRAIFEFSSKTSTAIFLIAPVS